MQDREPVTPEPADEAPALSRRRVIGAALGAVAAGAAASLGVARPAAAVENVGVFNSDVTTAVSGTVTAQNVYGVLGVSSATGGSSYGVKGLSSSPSGAGVYAEYVGDNASGGTGVIAKTSAHDGLAIFAYATGAAGTAISAAGGSNGIVTGALSVDGIGVDANAAGANAIGVRGLARDGAGGAKGTGVLGVAALNVIPARSNTGVFGYSEDGTGGYFQATGSGTALQANGRVRVNRGGRVSVGAGKTYADIDLTTKGGISSSTIIVATIQTYRTGVAVASVRKNYPSTGKARVYLTKVASTSSATTVGWVAIEA